MNPRIQQTLRWSVLVLATLVVIGVFLQVYFIAVFIFGSNADALDTHANLGGIVHTLEVLAFLAALGAYWKRWSEIGLAFALAAVGTIQLGLVEGDNEWVNGLHGLFALLVLILAHSVAHHAVRALGLGRHGDAPAT